MFQGLKFLTFPYLLTLQLKRFDFDYNTLHRIKLNDRSLILWWLDSVFLVLGLVYCGHVFCIVDMCSVLLCYLLRGLGGCIWNSVFLSMQPWGWPAACDEETNDGFLSGTVWGRSLRLLACNLHWVLNCHPVSVTSVSFSDFVQFQWPHVKVDMHCNVCIFLDTISTRRLKQYMLITCLRLYTFLLIMQWDLMGGTAGDSQD